MRSDSFQSEMDVVEDVPGYHPVNGLAIVAFLLAIPGGLGVFHPVFVLFPAFALLIAAFALWRNSRTNSASPRNGIAWSALALSAFLTCLPATLHFSNTARENRIAINVSQQWLELLRGKNPREAHLLTMSPTHRPLRGEDRANMQSLSPKTTVSYSTLDEFLSEPDVAMLADANTQIRFNRLSEKLISGLRIEYVIAYDLQIANSPRSDLYAVIAVQEAPGDDGIQYWQTIRYEIIGKK